MSHGTLTIVGTGIQLASHLTLGAQAQIKYADKVLYAVADPITAEWLATLNPNIEALPYNKSNKRRIDTYQEMAATMMEGLRQGQNLCVVFYGHPSVFVRPVHQVIHQARAEGFEVKVLPGISAEDCLFADLGIDPAQHGCQTFEAHDFLIHNRKFDPSSTLILWQIAVTGNPGFFKEGEPLPGVAVLAEVLAETYGWQHEVTIYEAAIYPTFEPLIQTIPLSELSTAPISMVSTLYVPPKEAPTVNHEMMARLGLTS